MDAAPDWSIEREGPRRAGSFGGPVAVHRPSYPSRRAAVLRTTLTRAGIPSLLVLIAFLITFGLIRAITFMIRLGVGPFHNVTSGGLHIHHMVWGILILLAVGYLWLVHFGAGETPIPKWVSSMSAIAYGVGAALTLDEFALWLNFKDVYWEKQGLESLAAVVVFLSLLGAAIWGGPFLAAVARECVSKLRSKRLLPGASPPRAVPNFLVAVWVKISDGPSVAERCVGGSLHDDESAGS